MTEQRCDVAVVGAGPTGLALANILGSFNVRTILIERNQTTVQEPRAVSIDDESLRTMQAIGLDADVIKDVVPGSGYRYFGPNGSCFVRVEPAARPYGFPRRSNFQQPLLEATLRHGLARFPAVRALFGHTCEGAVQDADAATLHVTDPDGRRLRIRASYVVGCDGARSTIRRAIDANLVGSSYQQRWLILDLSETREALRHSRVFCNPKRPAITLAGPHGTRRYEFMLHDHESDELATDPAFVRDLLARHGPDVDAPIVRRQVYTFHARIADRWRAGRIFIAGDAAHLSPPFAGQGMNSGLRDVHNLGWKLAAVAGGSLGPGLLDSYARERKPHASALIQMAVSIGRVMMPTSRLQAALIRAGFRLVGLVPPLQSYFAEMRYKPQPHYAAGFRLPSRHHSAVGRMLPQPLLEVAAQTIRFDDAIGPEFALVAYGADAEETAARAADGDYGLEPIRRVAIVPAGCKLARTETTSGAVIGRDVNDALHQMSRGRQLLLFVRPDRYVVGATAELSRHAISAFAASVRELVTATWRSVETAEDDGYRTGSQNDVLTTK